MCEYVVAIKLILHTLAHVLYRSNLTCDENLPILTHCGDNVYEV